jgi:hypothetical protein
MDEWFFITPARLGLTGARAQVSVGWKEICAVMERSLIGIQMRLPEADDFPLIIWDLLCNL